MGPILVASTTLICISLGLLVGLFLRERLPQHHLKDDSKDILKTSSGLIATLVALVLGLLVASTKSTFDAANTLIMQTGGKFIVLDRYLTLYGPETQKTREELKASLQAGIDTMWPSKGHGNPNAYPMAQGLENVYHAVVQLKPENDTQRQIQSVQVCNDLVQMRWQVVEQTQYALPTAFLVVLIFWLTVLYANFGLLSPRNVTALVALFGCAVSISGAIFLILEMTHPFDGTITVSSLPFEKAISQMGAE